jgi:hypothetical protein
MIRHYHLTLKEKLYKIIIVHQMLSIQTNIELVYVLKTYSNSYINPLIIGAR